MTARALKKVGLGSLLITAAALFLLWRATRIHGFIVALAPVDGGRAIVCVRANAEHGQGPRAWVGLLDAARGWVWSERLAGLPPVGVRDGLLVEDGVAFVRTEGQPGATTAYAVADGKRLWQTPIAEGGSRGVIDANHPAPLLDMIGGGTHLVQGLGGGADESVISLDRATGKVEWRHPLDRDRGMMAARVEAGTLVLDGLFQSDLLPLDGAASTRVQGRGRGCLEKGEYLQIEHAGQGYRLAARPLAPGGQPRVVVPTIELPAGSLPLVQSCGKYGGHLVLTLDLASSDRRDVALLELDPLSGRQVSLSSLGIPEISLVLQTRVDAMFPESAPLAGDLPRFVPLVVDAGSSTYQMAVLDLQERRIVRRGPASSEMLHTQILRRGDAFYVVSRLPSAWGDLGLFDGKTGQITAAVALRPHTAELKPFHVRDGHLWIYVDDWLDPLPYAVLSAETLVPVTVSAMKVESSLGAVGAAWLGDAPSPR